MAQVFNHFVCQYSLIAAPLHDLTKPVAVYHWSSECQNPFHTMKKLLTTAPVLHAPDSHSYFILETDAANKGEGVSLKARSYEDQKEYIVAYASCKFSSTKENWNIVEKEAYAILFETTKFCHYLIGKPFLTRTDNHINTYLQSKCSPKSPKLLNWALALSEFDYEVQHVRSKNNDINDCLSRMHCINVLFELKPEMSLNDLKTAQSQDPHLQAAINYLAANHRHFGVKFLGPPAHQCKKLYLSSDGVLYWKQCVVIPQQPHSSVLQLCHNHPCSGHFGI